METNEWVMGKVGFTVKGVPIEMEMALPVKPVKPQRMLPVFQKITNAFVDISADSAEKAGEKTSCKAGCGACCRQAVPISEIEVYQLAELVENMSEPRRIEIKKRFADADAHFRRIGWYDRMRKCGEIAKTESRETAMKEVANAGIEYFQEGIPCPFLENESCSIHASRPLACREYLVTSPAENCSSPTAETVRKIDLLAKTSVTIRSLVGDTAFSHDDTIGFLPLVRALDLAERFPESFPERTGERWAAEYFTRLTGNRIEEQTA